jgi:hypothetical protein
MLLPLVALAAAAAAVKKVWFPTTKKAVATYPGLGEVAVAVAVAVAACHGGFLVG